MADSGGPEGLVPARRVARRSRRRTTSAAVADSADPLTAALAALVALQASNDAILGELRELRRRVTSLSGKVEALDDRLTEGAALSRLRPSDPAGS